MLNQIRIFSQQRLIIKRLITEFYVLESLFRCGWQRVRRTSVSFSNWNFCFILALVQYLVYVTLYERFVEDKVINFLDLCSMSNISVFILIENLYGYYLHGRSPHGVADVDMKGMLTNFKREKEELIGRRGLEANSDEQMFIVKISQSFRSQFDNLVQSYRVNFIHLSKLKSSLNESIVFTFSSSNVSSFF